MIGLVASILVGVALQNYPFLLAAIPYLLRVKSRNLSLMAFYGYVILLALTLPGGSIYSWEGIKTALFASTSTFLLLDDVLRGVRIGEKEAIISGVLIASAFNDYALSVALIGVTLYLAYLYFGKAVYYLAGWLGASVIALAMMKDQLKDPVAQTFVVIGLGLILLMVAERKNVEFLEVGLREE